MVRVSAVGAPVHAVAAGEHHPHAHARRRRPGRRGRRRPSAIAGIAGRDGRRQAPAARRRVRRGRRVRARLLVAVGRRDGHRHGRPPVGGGEPVPSRARCRSTAASAARAGARRPADRRPTRSTSRRSAASSPRSGRRPAFGEGADFAWYTAVPARVACRACSRRPAGPPPVARGREPDGRAPSIVAVTPSTDGSPLEVTVPGERSARRRACRRARCTCSTGRRAPSRAGLSFAGRRRARRVPGVAGGCRAPEPIDRLPLTLRTRALQPSASEVPEALRAEIPRVAVEVLGRGAEDGSPRPSCAGAARRRGAGGSGARSAGGTG